MIGLAYPDWNGYFYASRELTKLFYFFYSQDCRILHGIEAMIADAASQSVMVERIGSRNSRWQLIKRKEFVRKHGELGGRDVDFQPVGTRLQNIDSSLSGSCSSDSSTGYVASHSKKRARSGVETSYTGNVLAGGVATNVSSASEGSNLGRMPQMYAKDNVSESSDGYNTSNNAKSLCTDASSGDDSYGGKERPLKRLPANIAKSGGIKHNFGAPQDAMTAKFNMVPTVGAQQDEAKSDFTASEGTSGPTVILNDAIGFSKDNVDELGSYYCINEDDMIVIDDILMCPFVFRSKNAVLCGALADCVMPGMLRAKFSKSNKLHSLEMIYDAMGFMQQLDRANGGDITAQIIPGSLEMALIHCPHEARVITEATPPYKIVYVNESWTRLTNYSQLEVEGQDLMSLLEGEDTDSEAGVRPGKPVHSLGEVAKGRPACSTNLHYNKDGQPFLDFMSSYPLTK
jgi:PAS domain-containing protein